jgi:Zn-dependent protease
LPDTGFAYVIVGIAVLLLSLTVHEAAHAWTADRLGDPTARQLGRVSLNPIVHIDPIGTVLFPLLAILTRFPLIGWAKPVPVNMRYLRDPRRDFTLVAAAGPLSNLFLAITAAVLIRLTSPGSLAEEVFTMAILINVLLALFNMIPVPPLDGGNVLAGLLPARMAIQFDRLRPYGILILYALMFSGILGALVFDPAYAIVSWLI